MKFRPTLAAAMCATGAQRPDAPTLEALTTQAGSIGHDINNMLTVVSAYGQLLLKGYSQGSREAQILIEMLDAAAQACELTGELLATCRRHALEPAPQADDSSNSSGGL